jgi:hypothetical protein
MHQDAWGSAFSNRMSPAPWNGEGAPPWATCTGGQTFTAPPLWSNAYFDPAVKAAVHNFFSNDVRGDLQTSSPASGGRLRGITATTRT